MPDSRRNWADELIDSLAPRWGLRPEKIQPDALPEEAPDRVALDTMLSTGLLRTPYIQVFADGSLVASPRYTRTRTVLGGRATGFVDAGLVREFLADGATVLLPQLDEWYRPVAKLADALSARTRRRVSAFQFYTPPGQQGLAIHRDDTDVILLQTAGSKRWTVYAGPTDGGWAPGPVAEPGDPVFETELSAGEILYIPRGFAHAGIGGDTFSAHLSFAIAQIGSAELRHALGRLIGEVAPDLPPRPLDEPLLVDTAAQLLAQLRRRIDELSPQLLVELARKVPHTDRRDDPGLPAD